MSMEATSTVAIRRACGFATREETLKYPSKGQVRLTAKSGGSRPSTPNAKTCIEAAEPIAAMNGPKPEAPTMAVA